MKNNDISVLKKMIDYCADIDYLMNRFEKNYTNYENDISFQYACNMCIIQIGELVTRLSDTFIERHPEIPWHAIRGMRNLHAHDYEHIDLEIVWNTLCEDIPDLRAKLETLI